MSREDAAERVRWLERKVLRYSSSPASKSWFRRAWSRRIPCLVKAAAAAIALVSLQGSSICLFALDMEVGFVIWSEEGIEPHALGHAPQSIPSLPALGHAPSSLSPCSKKPARGVMFCRGWYSPSHLWCRSIVVNALP